MEEKEGKVEKFNQKEGFMPGILIENKWYNATKITKQYVERLKGKEGSIVRMKIEGNKINHLSIIREENSSSSQQSSISDGANKDLYWKKKEERDIETQKQLNRKFAISCAVESLKSTGNCEGKSADVIISTAARLAETFILPYIYGESIPEMILEEEISDEK